MLTEACILWSMKLWRASSGFLRSVKVAEDEQTRFILKVWQELVYKLSEWLKYNLLHAFECISLGIHWIWFVFSLALFVLSWVCQNLILQEIREVGTCILDFWLWDLKIGAFMSPYPAESRSTQVRLYRHHALAPVVQRLCAIEFIILYILPHPTQLDFRPRWLLVCLASIATFCWFENHGDCSLDSQEWPDSFWYWNKFTQRLQR